MRNLSQSLLLQGNEIKILALNTLKHFVNTESLPGYFKTDFHLEAITIDTSVKSIPAFVNLFSDQSYNISRFYSSAFEKRLTEILKTNKYDVVLAESLFMFPYLEAIRKNSSAKIVLRAHNVEHIIWERLCDSETNPLKKWYLKTLTKKLKKYEVTHLNKPDAILAITKEDQQIFNLLGCTIPIHVTPLGIDLKDYQPSEENKSEWCLFHLGSMDWLPNLEAVKWFLENCWNAIHNEFSGLKLFLAGRGFPKSLMENNFPNVICEGEIADSNKYMHDKQIMIVPLLSGSGMRVKIIQGMALEKTIISTSIGAEGIQFTNGENILIANTPLEFLAAVKKCLADKNYAKQIGENGRKLVAEKYSNEAIGKSVTSFLSQLNNQK